MSKIASIEVTKVELEMIRVLLQGTRDDLHYDGKEAISINLSASEVKYIFDHIETLIESLEADHGDWIRASEYRKAKSPLIAKLRPFVFGLIPQ